MDTTQNNGKDLLRQAMEGQRQRAARMPDTDESGSVPFCPADTGQLMTQFQLAPAKPKRVDPRTPEQQQADRARLEASRLDAERQARVEQHKKSCEHRWKYITDAVGPLYADKRFADRELYGTPEQQARQTDVYGCVAAFAKNVKAHTTDGKNLLLFGSKGTGKDYAMVECLRHATMRHALYAAWWNGADLWMALRESMGRHAAVTEAQLIHRLSSDVGILAISDPVPPNGAVTDYQAAALLTIIDKRYRFGRPTWMTLNVANRAEFESRMGALSVDRLLHNAETLFFDWPSYREYARNKTTEGKP